MEKLLVIICIALMCSCSKEDSPAPDNNNGNDTTVVDTNTVNTSAKFQCKVNGKLFTPDSAYAVFGPSGLTEGLAIYSLRSSEDGTYLEEAVQLSLQTPFYTGAGTYEVIVDTVEIFKPTSGLTYAWGTSVASITTYQNTLCYNSGTDTNIGSAGSIVITKDHTGTVVSGTFYGTVCRGDSVITITEGVFNDVSLTK